MYVLILKVLITLNYLLGMCTRTPGPSYALVIAYQVSYVHTYLSVSISEGSPIPILHNMAWIMRSRERWKDADASAATCGEFSGTLMPYADKKTFLQYGDRLDRKALIEKRDLLAALRKLNEKFAFTQRQVRGGLKRLLKDRLNQKGWHVDDEKPWIETNDKRLRTMCRHVAQTEGSRPTTAWLRAMPWRQVGGEEIAATTTKTNDDQERDDDDDADESQDALFESQRQKWKVFFPKSQPANEHDLYTLGYSSTAKAAWRVLKSASKKSAAKEKEWAGKFQWEEGSDVLVAVWDDCMSKEIPDVSVETARKIEAERDGSRADAAISDHGCAAMSTSHSIKDTRIKVFVAPQKGRDLLVLMKENGQQKNDGGLQVVVRRAASKR